MTREQLRDAIADIANGYQAKRLSTLEMLHAAELLASLVIKDKLIINGQEITATHIAFDGCHKIYLINTPEDLAEAKSYKYEPVEATAKNLRDIWAKSCPLRFIHMWGGDYDNVIPQGFEDKVVIS